MQQYPHNPYAAPVAAAGPSAPGVAGPTRDWEIGEVLSQAWTLFKQQWAVLVFAPLVLQVIYFVVAIGLQFGVAALAEVDATLSMIAGLFVALIQFAVMLWVLGGTIKLFVAAARGESPEFGVAFSAFERLLPLALGMLLLGIGYIIGFVLLIVPGVIFALGTMFAQYFIVDRELGPIEAIKRSWEVANGQKMKLFLYGLVSFFVIVLGYVACIVGVLVASPVVMLGLAIIYTRLSGTAGPQAVGAGPGGVGAFGSAGGYPGFVPGAPGGYGAPAGGGPGAGYPQGGHAAPAAGAPAGYPPQGGGAAPGQLPGGGYGPPGAQPPFGGGSGYGSPGYPPPGAPGSPAASGYGPPGYAPPGGAGGYGTPGAGGYGPGGYGTPASVGYGAPPGGGQAPPGPGYGSPGAGGYPTPGSAANPPAGGGYGPPGGGGGYNPSGGGPGTPGGGGRPGG